VPKPVKTSRKSPMPSGMPTRYLTHDAKTQTPLVDVGDRQATVAFAREETLE